MRDCLAAARTLREKCSSLACTVVYIGDDAPYVRIDGTVRLDAEQGGVRLVADYELSIIVGEDYPASVPKVRLCGDAPRAYPHIDPDGFLCLGVNGEIAMILSDSAVPLIAFYDNVLLPNLYAIEYYERYGVMPFGDRSHGDQGVLEFYREFFATDDDDAVYKLLRAAAFPYSFRRRDKCPCGSRQRATRCHASHIDRLTVRVEKGILKNDLSMVAAAVTPPERRTTKVVTRQSMKGSRKKHG